MPRCSARIGSELRQLACWNQIRPLRCTTLYARCQELHRPRSEPFLQSEIHKLYDTRTKKIFMSMARAVRTVAVLSCGSSEHAERLPSNADMTIWQVCLECTLTFISSCTGAKTNLFSSIHAVAINVLILFSSCSSSPPRNGLEKRFEICFYPGGFLKRCVIHEIFQHFMITLIPENSTKFVSKRDLRNTWQICRHCF